MELVASETRMLVSVWAKIALTALWSLPDCLRVLRKLCLSRLSFLWIDLSAACSPYDLAPFYLPYYLTTQGARAEARWANRKHHSLIR